MPLGHIFVFFDHILILFLISLEPTTVGIDIEYQLLEAAKAGDIEVVKVCLYRTFIYHDHS